MSTVLRSAYRPQSRVATRRPKGFWPTLTDSVLGVVETVILLPVLLAWWLLYRWSPDPP